MRITKAIWQSEQLAGLPWECRFLLVGLMTLADASGRVEWDPARVKTLICPYDLTLDEFRAAANKLRKARVLRAVVVDGVQYAQIATIRGPGKQRRVPKEPTTPAAPVQRYEAATFWIKTGERWHAPQALFEQLVALYPALDVEREFMRASVWTFTNTSQRKTERGMLRFIRTWVENAQNKMRVDDKPKPSRYTPALPEFEP